MAYIQKRGDKWRVEVCIDLKRQSKTFPTKREAVLWANDQEDRGTLSRHTFREAVEKYRPIASANKGAQSELSRLKTLLTAKFVDMPLDRITPAMIGEYRDGRLATKAPNSVRREMIVLSSIFREVCGEWGWLHESPMQSVKTPPRQKARMRGIAQHEIDDILPALRTAKIGDQVACMFELSIETAARLGELVELKWSDVSEKYVVLKEKTREKGLHTRKVPLSVKARTLINQRRGIDPVMVFTVTRDAASKAFQRARTDAKHPTVHFHDARSEAITRLSKRLDILQLAKMVGHRDPRSLMMYYAETPESIADKLG